MSVSRAATPALAALTDAGVPHEVVKFAHDPRERSFGDEAVRALTTTGAVAPEQIYKTLIIAVGDGLAVAVLPVPARLSLKAAASALGGGKAAMADQRAAERARRCRPSPTPARWRGSGCTAAPADAAGTSRWHPAT